jgi:hypothetical protein
MGLGDAAAYAEAYERALALYAGGIDAAREGQGLIPVSQQSEEFGKYRANIDTTIAELGDRMREIQQHVSDAAPGAAPTNQAAIAVH